MDKEYHSLIGNQTSKNLWILHQIKLLLALNSSFNTIIFPNGFMKRTSLRIVLALWHYMTITSKYQIDAKTTFLNGVLQEEIFILQLEDNVCFGNENEFVGFSNLFTASNKPLSLEWFIQHFPFHSRYSKMYFTSQHYWKKLFLSQHDNQLI